MCEPWNIVYVVSFLGASEPERITPPGVHALNTAALQRGDWIAVATRQSNCEYRHVEIFRLESNEFMKLTELVNPNTHHYNPFVFSDSDCWIPQML